MALEPSSRENALATGRLLFATGVGTNIRASAHRLRRRRRRPRSPRTAWRSRWTWAPDPCAGGVGGRLFLLPRASGHVEVELAMRLQADVNRRGEGFWSSPLAFAAGAGAAREVIQAPLASIDECAGGRGRGDMLLTRRATRNGRRRREPWHVRRPSGSVRRSAATAQFFVSPCPPRHLGGKDVRDGASIAAILQALGGVVELPPFRAFGASGCAPTLLATRPTICRDDGGAGAE